MTRPPVPATPTSSAEAPAASGRPRRRLRRAVVTFAILTALLLALLVRGLIVKPYKIPSPSMAPTLEPGQRIFVDRLAPHLHPPHRGDIIVFHPPPGTDRSDPCAVVRAPHRICGVAERGADDVAFVKRVVGLPGDRIGLRAGQVVRNGRPVPESYARRCSEESCSVRAFRVPAGTVFVLGDNRGNSNDSRFWGPVAEENVIGRAFLTYWPLDRAGSLH